MSFQHQNILDHDVNDILIFTVEIYTTERDSSGQLKKGDISSSTIKYEIIDKKGNVQVTKNSSQTSDISKPDDWEIEVRVPSSELSNLKGVYDHKLTDVTNSDVLMTGKVEMG